MPYHVIVANKLSNAEKNEISNSIAQTFLEIDEIFNVYNPSSELSRLNRASAMAYYPLSNSLYQMLSFCNGLVQISSNRFDPTIAPLTELWKDAFAKKTTPSSDQLQAVSDAVGWQHISLQGKLFRKDNDATSVDLNSPVKGLCVDWIIERLQAMGYPNLFVEWDGKIRTTGLDGQKKWQVQVDPMLRMNGHSIAPIDLGNAAMATSADCRVKNWHLLGADGKDHYYFHIIDPHQCQPIEKTSYSICSVTVIAPTCALASSLATTAMVFSTRKDALKWAQEIIEFYPQVSFWILAYDIKPNQ